MLKIFTSREWLPYDRCNHVHLLYPVWGYAVEAVYQGSPIYNGFDSAFKNLFELTTTIEEADILLVPGDYKHYKKKRKLDVIDRLVALAEANNKRILIFFKSDDDSPIHIQSNNLIVYRTSIYKTTKETFEYAMPVWSDDLKIELKSISPKSVMEMKIPSVSFCGQIAVLNDLSSIYSLLRYYIAKYFFPHYFTSNIFLRRNFSRLRSDILNILNNDSKLLTNFILRSNYFGGAWQGWGKFDIAAYKDARIEYLKNMDSSIYVVCVRGAGNYSLRFYEAMSAGRIPIILDTDCVQPFMDQIKWNEHVIEIDLVDLNRASSIIADWHYNHTEDELKGIMSQNRLIWEKYLSPEGFYKTLCNTISGHE